MCTWYSLNNDTFSARYLWPTDRLCNAFGVQAWFTALVCFLCGCMATSASVWNVYHNDCCCWILDYMTVVWYDGDMFFICLRDALGIGLVRGIAMTWCVCLSVKPTLMTFWGLGRISLNNIAIRPKLGRCKIRPSIAKLSGNVYMWVGVAGALHNSDVTIVTSNVTTIVTSQQWRWQWRHK